MCVTHSDYGSACTFPTMQRRGAPRTFLDDEPARDDRRDNSFSDYVRYRFGKSARPRHV